MSSALLITSSYKVLLKNSMRVAAGRLKQLHAEVCGRYFNRCPAAQHRSHGLQIGARCASSGKGQAPLQCQADVSIIDVKMSAGSARLLQLHVSPKALGLSSESPLTVIRGNASLCSLVSQFSGIVSTSRSTAHTMPHTADSGGRSHAACATGLTASCQWTPLLCACGKPLSTDSWKRRQDACARTILSAAVSKSLPPLLALSILELGPGRR